MSRTKIFIVLAIVGVILILAFAASRPDTNDGKCDVCGKEKYAKLADGNEYCYTHYKKALSHYLDD